MKTDNVIEFPSSKIIRPPVVNNEMIEKVQIKGVTNLAASMSADFISALLNDFESAGLDTESDQFHQDFSFVALAVQAVVYRSLELEFPFQKVLDQVKIVEIENTDLPETPEQ